MAKVGDAAESLSARSGEMSSAPPSKWNKLPAIAESKKKWLWFARAGARGGDI